MQRATLFVFAAVVAMALAEGQYYIPRAYYVIDAEGHASAPVPLRRLRRALNPYNGGSPYPYNGGNSANANANAHAESQGWEVMLMPTRTPMLALVLVVGNILMAGPTALLTRTLSGTN